VRVFTGRDAEVRSTQVSRTVRGTKKDARVAGELTLKPSHSAGRTVTQPACWVIQAWSYIFGVR
jgi:hypothetical protein